MDHAILVEPLAQFWRDDVAPVPLYRTVNQIADRTAIGPGEPFLPGDRHYRAFVTGGWS